MDSETTSVLAVIGVAVSVGGAILSVINHTRVKSMCCGRKLEVSFDVDKTQPSPPTIERQNTVVVRVADS